MKSQLGRSMIEMLGVLAIIGVLSIGGLAGYTRAMRANRINNIADYVNRAWLEIKARRVSGNIQSSVAYFCDDLLNEDLPTGLKNCQLQVPGYPAYDGDLLIRLNSEDMLLGVIDRLNAANNHYPDVQPNYNALSLIIYESGGQLIIRTYNWANYSAH